MKIKNLLRNKKLVAGIAASLVILVAAGIMAGLLLSKHSTPDPKTVATELNIKGISITPAKSDGAGVDVDSFFQIKGADGLSEKELSSVIKVTPLQTYKLKKVTDGEFQLSFDSPMSPNKVYRFALGDQDAKPLRSWAFQTKTVFKALRSLPRDKSTGVPANSGIEITLSYENMQDVTPYFQITPQVKGRFEYHKKTVVFVPEILKPGTLYTVTLKKGLGLKDSSETTQEDYSFQFQTDPGSTPGQSTDSFSFANILYNFTAQATPALEVFADEALKDKGIQVDVYQYPDEKGFVSDLKKFDTLPSWAYLPSSQVSFDTGKLAKVMSFQANISTGGDGSDWYYPHYLLLPSTLPEGHYVVTAVMGKKTVQTHLQVNNTSVYVSVLKDKTLAWINDSVTGNPIEGATVEFDGVKAAKTGKDGVALIGDKLPQPQTGSHYRFQVKTGSKQVFAGLVDISHQYTFQDYYSSSYYDYDSKNVQDTYWTYLYLDRGLYLPQDTVKIWGLVKPRKDAEPVKKGKLRLVTNAYGYTDVEDANILASQEVEVSSFGTFEGQLSFSNLSPGDYSVQFVSDKTVYTTSTFQVKQYTKPAYRLNVTPDKTAVFSGDPVKFDIQSEFFEGTPAPGLKLHYYYSYTRNTEGQLQCDGNGRAALTVTPQDINNSWHPQLLNLSLNSDQAEEQEVTANSWVTVFPRDVMLDLDAKKTGSTVKVDIRSNAVDPSRIKGLYDFENTDLFRGKTMDMPVKLSIAKKHWEATEIGTQYDFISKTTYKKYEYHQVIEPVEEFDLTTSGGKCTKEFPAEEGKVYSITVTGYDTRNNLISETRDYYFGYVDESTQPRMGYRLENETEKDYYKTGDKISLRTVANDPSAAQKPVFKSLFLKLQNGYQGYTITNGNDYTFDFSKECIPNLYVSAACFDGSNIYNAGTKNFGYDSSQQKLDLKVSTDKSEYKPGDTVHLDVAVKDSASNPQKAAVNVSVVDEALFALQDQNVYTLASLYSYNLNSGLLNTYVSYTPIDPNFRNSMAEQGGEGGDMGGIRSKFKDTAFFSSVVTDKDGKASLDFKLPDNLTSWRITYQSITNDLKAGNGRLNISTKKPFFTDVIFNTTFMTGDSPYITARSFGTALKPDDSVEYTATLEDSKGKKTDFSAKSSAQGFTGIDLGKLATGDYSITVKAKYGSYSDGIKRSFSVKDSLLEAARTKTYKLDENTRIEGGKSLTRLTFYNGQSSFLYNTLTSLKYTWGERVDQVISRKVASQLLKKYFSEEDPWLMYQDEDADLTRYQLSDGGIGLLTYDSSDPVLSAKICAAAKDSFDQGALANYFYGILANKESTAENVAASYWGLASLGEPVLLDTRNLLNSQGIGLKEKLYLSAALAALGDDSGAEEVYKGVLVSNSKEVPPLRYIDSKDTRDDTMELTTLAAVIAIKLDEPEKMALFNYVQESYTKDILVNLEELIMVQNTKPDFTSTGKFKYTLDGKTTSVALEKSNQYQLLLTPEKLAGLKFTDISGDVSVTANYVGPVKDLVGSGKDLVKLERSYETNGRTSKAFKQSDLVKITIRPKFEENAPDGFYEVTDALPAGFKYVEGKLYDDTKWYPQEVSGQRVVFGFYYGKNNPNFSAKDTYITYYARAVNPGEFTADNAVIRHYDSNITGFTAQGKINISK